MKIHIKRMNWFVRLITFGWPDAITLMPFGIYVKDEYLDDQQTIHHELIHACQQKEMLILPFYIWYFAEWLIRLVTNWGVAYMSVSFEREAYRNDDVINYLSNRKPFAWLAYLRQEARFKVKWIYRSGRELIRLRSEINNPKRLIVNNGQAMAGVYL